MSTNITQEHSDNFNAIVSGKYDNLCLFSCFINGEPGVALCAAVPEGGDIMIKPMFVSITPGMKLTDHEGVEA